MLASLAIAGVLTLPAWLNTYHDPVQDNLVTKLTGLSFAGDTSEFMAGWQEVGQQIKGLHIPLWQAQQYQPLLESTEAPAFYPGSLLFYFGGSFGLLLFYAAHLALLAFSSMVLLWNSRRRWLWLGLAGLGLVGICTLRPDAMAAWAWLPLALGLVRWRRHWIGLILLPIPLGMMGLSTVLPVTLLLYPVVISWWVIGWYYPRRENPGSLLPRLLLVLLAVVGGIGIAGPQLFPRLAYHGTYFDPQLGAFSQPAPRTINVGQVTHYQIGNSGELTINLQIPAHTQETTVLVTGRPGSNFNNTGWTGQFWQTTGPDTTATGKRGPEVTLTGNQNLQATISFDAASVSSTDSYWLLKISYQPLSFLLGLYATFIVLFSQGLLALDRWVGPFLQPKRRR